MAERLEQACPEAVRWVITGISAELSPETAIDAQRPRYEVGGDAGSTTASPSGM